MSIRCTSRVWEESIQKGTNLLMLLALADYANDQQVCWPGMEALAHHARVQERQARTLVHEIAKAGELLILPVGGVPQSNNFKSRDEPGPGRYHTNNYLITIGLEASDIVNILVQRFGYEKGHAQEVAADVFYRLAESRRPAGKGKAGETPETSPTTSGSGTVGTRVLPVETNRQDLAGLSDDRAKPAESRRFSGDKPAISCMEKAENRQSIAGKPLTLTVNVPVDKRTYTDDYWEKVRAQLRLQTTRSTYESCLLPCHGSYDETAKELRLYPNDVYAAQWIDLRLRKIIERNLTQLGQGQPVKLIIVKPALPL